MEYNVKVSDYEGVLNVSFYESKISRKDEEENENIQKSITPRKSDFKNRESATWHNPATHKMEIVPKGFGVRVEPFDMMPYLYPEIEYEPEFIKGKYYSIEDANKFKPFQNMQTEDDWIQNPIFQSEPKENESETIEFLEVARYVRKQILEDENYKEWRSLYNSTIRAKKSIYEIAKANKWELFVTFTIGNEEKRLDYDEAKKTISKRINNVKTKKGLTFGYILVAEEFKKGGWHFHGLIDSVDGLTLEKARSAKSGRLLKTKDKQQIYNIKEFKSVGYNTATYVTDTIAIAKYITKYITKDLEKNYPNKRKFLASQGLKRANVVMRMIDGVECIPELLEQILGYVPDKVFESIKGNPYTLDNIIYQEYRK